MIDIPFTRLKPYSQSTNISMHDKFAMFPSLYQPPVFLIQPPQCSHKRRMLGVYVNLRGFRNRSTRWMANRRTLCRALRTD